MAYDIYTRHDSRIGMLEQTTWGTAKVAADAFHELPNDPGAVFDQGVNLRRPDRSYASTLGGQRMQDIRDVQNDTKGSMPTITTSGDVRKDEFADLLYLVMQGVTEGGSTPYLKQFQFPTTQPDFTASEGMFCSVCGRHPLASSSVLMPDSIIRTLTLSGSPDANEGRMHFNAEYIGRPLSHQFNPSGTWTRVPEEFFYFHDIGGVLLDVSSIDIFSYELVISNNAVPTGVEVGAATGKFKSYALPKYTVTGKISVLWDADKTYTWMRAIYPVGTVTIFRLYWGNSVPSADGDLRFDMSAVITSAPRILGDIHQIELGFEMVSNVVTSAEDCDDHGLVVQLGDASEREW